MIEVAGVQKRFGSVQAVSDVSFSVDAGEVVGILGPNGAGKTTTLNMITGVTFPDAGKITIDGQPLKDISRSVKRNIGYLAEDNPLYRSLLVSETLKMTAELKGITAMEFSGEQDRIASVTGIREIYYRPIETLSKGLRQRVGIAQALVGNPKVLILDEPTEGLDPNQRQEIRKLISELRSDHTILISTHVMQEVEAICQRVIILHQGRVVSQGTLAEVTSKTQGSLQVKVRITGGAGRVAGLVRDKGYTVITESGPDEFVVVVGMGEEHEFYKLLAVNTNEELFLTELTQLRQNLEDVFAALTKGVNL